MAARTGKKVPVADGTGLRGGTLMADSMEPVRNEPAQKREAEPQARKPYRKPGFVYERAFETMALSCGKIGATQAQCKTNRKNS